jgi:excinuclease ABC subunit A
MVDLLISQPDSPRAIILSPQVVNRKGEHREIFAEARRNGFTRVRVNGEILRLDEEIHLEDKRKHSIEVVIDRLTLNPEAKSRLTDSVETALKYSEGMIIVHFPDTKKDMILSEKLACIDCGISFSEVTPQSFSFNSPLGMCVACNGLGTGLQVDESRFIANSGLSIAAGGIIPWANAMRKKVGWTYQYVMSVLKHFGIDPDKPVRDYSEDERNIIFYGTPEGRGAARPTSFRGLANSWLEKLKESAETEHEIDDRVSRYMKAVPCSSCGGSRLKPESRSVKIKGLSLAELCAMTVKEADTALAELELDGNEKTIAEELLKEIRARLGFLCSVGLDYLTLDRQAPTLSGGESQRIRLASQIGSELTGVLYILDEPSIGLHQRDNTRLIKTLLHLRDLGNTVLVVEHDREMIEAADYLVDFGPGAGVQGGEVVFAGSYEQMMAENKTLTARYLSGELCIQPPVEKVKPDSETGEGLEIIGATENNLRGVNVRFPVGCMTAVTGVSGAGKSSLINGILWPAAQNYFNRSSNFVGEHQEIKGFELFDKVIDINQQPIGRTPRSNPATYVKLFDLIREFFAGLEESKIYGYKPGRFSFNVKGGRCETCQGAGMIKVEMHFLADVWVPCDSCGGRRFNQATLRVKFKGKNISEILGLTVDEACDFFANIPNIYRILKTLQKVGLGYIALGQPATTLSGGEAQRIKLAKELARRSTGRTLYLLDEPTTGLHFDDIRKLLIVLRELVAQGNTIIIIEHNLDVIRCADYIVDLGPDGGRGGGQILYQGPIDKIEAAKKQSSTIQYLLAD